MFEIINKARVVYSMLTGKPARVKSKQSGKIFTIKYITKLKHFEVVDEQARLIDKVEIL